MPTLQVTAKKLNKRRQIPANFPDPVSIIGIVKEGYTFEGTEVDETDVPNIALGKWYADRDGYFYWGGGLHTIVPAAIPALAKEETGFKFDPARMSWAHESVSNGGVGIVDLWNKLGVRGEGVNVAIFDTGITSNRSDFEKDGVSVIKGMDFIKGTGLDDAIDFDGHGTNSAGILGATGMKLVTGIAPGSNLFIIRIAGNHLPGFDRLKKGLQLLRTNNWNVDIISISFCFPNADTELESIFDSFDKRIVILSALNHPNGANGFLTSDEQFPAIYPNVISVSAADKNLQRIMSPCNFPSFKPVWAFPGENILTLDENGNSFPMAGQTSIATPLGSGIFALYLSCMKKKAIPLTIENVNTLKRLLSENSKSLFVNIAGNEREVKLCQPLRAFDAFNNHFKLNL